MSAALAPYERLEHALFDLLQLLSAADAPALAVVEQALDPAGTAAQFFAACEVRHELGQARTAVERAQQLLNGERSAQTFTASCGACTTSIPVGAT